MKEGAAEGRIGRDAGLAITEAMVDAAIARDAAMREERIQRAGIRARERELRLAREFTPPHAPRVRQRWSQTSSFLRCTDAFYAKVDYDIRMWERERDYRLGVRQVVEEVEAERPGRTDTTRRQGADAAGRPRRGAATRSALRRRRSRCPQRRARSTGKARSTGAARGRARRRWPRP